MDKIFSNYVKRMNASFPLEFGSNVMSLTFLLIFFSQNYSKAIIFVASFKEFSFFKNKKKNYREKGQKLNRQKIEDGASVFGERAFGFTKILSTSYQEKKEELSIK